MNKRAEVAKGDMLDARKLPVVDSFGELWDLLKEDHKTHSSKRSVTVLKPGFLALAVYRTGVWANGRPRIIRSIIRKILAVPAYFIRNCFGINLFSTSHIGRRLRILNHSGIIIHSRARIGDDCTIRQGVTIGFAGNRGFASVPSLGNRVQVGAGAVIAGAARIGDDVRIAANAVVMMDVPAGSLVASPQARIMAPPPRRQLPATDTPPPDGWDV